MAGQIIFFEKNKADITQPNISATASQGASYASYALNRNPFSAWVTTGSVDADNTTWTVDLVDPVFITDILIVRHNFKSYKIEYWDSAAWQTFPTAIDETTNTETTNRHSFTSTEVYKLRITVRGTQTANDDKYLFQFIATNLIGQLAGWPIIKKPTVSKNKQSSKMLSGRLAVAENLGSFSCSLTVSNWKSSADLAIVEELYSSQEGFLVWLGGGVESQFSSAREGYRKRDIFLMKCVDEYQPEFVDGLYQTGLRLDINLSEVV